MTNNPDQPTGLTVRRMIDCTPEAAYDAWVVPEIVRQWNPPGEGGTYAFDVRIGGSFYFLFTHEGVEQPHTGEYNILDRPNKIQHSWKSPATNMQETQVTLEFTGRDGRTEIALTHTDLPPESVKDHTSGWTMILEMMGNWLEANTNRP